MLGELRGRALLQGARGTPPANLDLVAEAITGLADTALSLNGTLHTLEVNPLWVNGDQVEALDVLVATGPERAKGPPAATGLRSDGGATREGAAVKRDGEVGEGPEASEGQRMTEQEELRASVRRFLADRAPLSRVRELMETEDGTDRAVWAQAGTQLGLQGLAIPQAYGGVGWSRSPADPCPAAWTGRRGSPPLSRRPLGSALRSGRSCRETVTYLPRSSARPRRPRRRPRRTGGRSPPRCPGWRRSRWRPCHPGCPRSPLPRRRGLVDTPSALPDNHF